MAAFVVGQLLWFDVSLQAALTVSFGWAIVMLSVVVLLGYTGQLSLGQFAFVGLGAMSMVVARIPSDLGREPRTGDVVPGLPMI